MNSKRGNEIVAETFDQHAYANEALCLVQSAEDRWLFIATDQAKAESVRDALRAQLPRDIGPLRRVSPDDVDLNGEGEEMEPIRAELQKDS